MNETLQKAIKKFLEPSANTWDHLPERINTDSRSIQSGDLFISLKGANFDGHQFIFDALIQGASLALSELERNELEKLPNYSQTLLAKVIQVKSTLQAYHDIARIYKTNINPLCIGITGSSGKTTTKELMKLVFAEYYQVHATEANHNNEFGVPKTLLSMPESTQILIVEMAMRGLNQIDLLSKTTEPNIALITNIGTAHIEILKSRDNIRKAKMEILTGLSDYKGWMELQSTFIIDEDLYGFCKEHNFIDPNSNKPINAKKILSFNSKANYQINGLVSEGILADINAIALTAKLTNLTEKQIQQGLSKYSPGKGRGAFITDSNNSDIYIDETYNANPEAIRNSIKALIKQFPKQNKIVVIGLVLESQEEILTELFNELKRQNNEGLFTFIDARNLETDQIKREIQSFLKPDMQNVILVKASRGAKLERIFE